MSDFNLITDPDFTRHAFFYENRAFRTLMQGYLGEIDSTSLNLSWLFYKAGYREGWIGAGGPPKTIEELLEGGPIRAYTREEFLADLERLTKRLCRKHGIQASEIPELIRTHNYTHTAEDPEDEWMEIMAFARFAGWPEAV